MPMIDLQAIDAARLERDPYEYAVIQRSFRDGATAHALDDGFAVDGFIRSERRPADGPGKQYLMHNRTLVMDGKPVLEAVGSLPAVWQYLVDDLISDRYKAALATLTRTDLDACVIQARMTRYSQGCWIQPHTDRPDKVVTHLFYFNQVWKPEWNGDFRVLCGPRMEDCVRRVLPLLGTSVVLVRSDRSWHGVPPVSEGCPDDRQALLVHFVRL